MNRHLWLRCLACAVLVTMFACAGTVPARAEQVLCSVTPAPVTASTPAAYTVRISTNPYDRVDQLRITFPFDTGFTMGSFAPSMVVVNGVQSRGGQIQKLATTNQIQMDILLSTRLSAGTPLTIVIARDVGILNPLSPRSCYRLMVSFFCDGREFDGVESDLYAITPSAIGSVTAAIDPVVAGAAADVVVSFQTGSNGRLMAGQDSVNISFPLGFNVPQSFGLADVTLNGVSCDGRFFRDNASPNTVLVYVPVDIPARSLVIVRIPAKAGIKNPAVAGPVVLSVYTTAEVTPIDTPVVEIRGREVTGLTVQLTTPVAGSPTGLQLHFGLSAVGRLTQGQLVHVRLPVGYAAPAPTTTVQVTVNGTTAAATIAAGGIDVAVPAYLSDESSVNLVLPVEFGIVNPMAPMGYAWTVWTDSDTVPIVAMALVQASSASGATLLTSTVSIGRSASWTVTFTPSSAATFPAAGESIMITFDGAILVPARLGDGSVTVNGVLAAAAAQGATIVVTVPTGVVPSGIITLVLNEQVGIRTPAVPGPARIHIATTRDSNPIASSAVEFRSLPVAMILVTPDAPNGVGGRYVATKPMVRLVNEDSSLYYRIDEGAYQLYSPGTSIAIDEGSHTLTAYAVARDGTQGEPSSRSFVVDLTKPVVTLTGATGDLFVRSTSLTITGTVSELVDVLQFNGIAAVVAADLTFSVALNVSDGQALACFARDLAGNTVTFVRTIRVDTTAPAITRQGPFPAESTVHADSISIRVTVSEPASVNVNGIPMTQTGSVWEAMVPLFKGENAITVTAVDRAGNEGRLAWTVTRNDVLTIRLVVGQTTAMVGDEQRLLDAPPIIVNGVTFVPLRFIGEALGAQVTWSPALQVVFLVRGSSQVQLTVGSKLAIIDGKITQLAEAPFIQNGRTMVPLRFISEAFGADVTWDQATQAVTVSLADAT